MIFQRAPKPRHIGASKRARVFWGGMGKRIALNPTKQAARSTPTDLPVRAGAAGKFRAAPPGARGNEDAGAARCGCCGPQCPHAPQNWPRPRRRSAAPRAAPAPLQVLVFCPTCRLSDSESLVVHTNPEDPECLPVVRALVGPATVAHHSASLSSSLLKLRTSNCWLLIDIHLA